MANIFDLSFFSQSFQMSFTELLILIFFCVFLTFILPRLKTETGMFLTLALLVGFITTHKMLDPLSEFWSRIFLPTLVLIVGYFIVVSKRIWAAKNIRKKGTDTSGMEQKGVCPTMAVESGIRSNPIGSTIGGYEVSEEIRKDFMGVIFRGQDPKTGVSVAIKTVKFSEFDEDRIPEVRDRFFRETRFLPLMKHTNIVTVYDCGQEQDMFYIVTEDMESEELKNFTKKGQLLPIREVLSIIGYAAEALDYAHRKNVIHQYVGRESIIRVKRTKDIKIKEFGIGWIASALKSKRGTISESYLYMSPEQIAGKRVDGRSDIFSLGVVLFEMLTGERPFAGEDMPSIMLNISKERHPSPRYYNPKIPRVIEKIIDRTLEKDLEKRYQNAGQLAVHLKRVVARINELMDRKRVSKKS